MKLYDFTLDRFLHYLYRYMKKAYDFCFPGQEAERKFALNLLGLYQNIRRAVSVHDDLSHGIERTAELIVGRFGGIDVRTFSFRCSVFSFSSLS